MQRGRVLDSEKSPQFSYAREPAAALVSIRTRNQLQVLLCFSDLWLPDKLHGLMVLKILIN
jgi:hypothetical protein